MKEPFCMEPVCIIFMAGRERNKEAVIPHPVSNSLPVLLVPVSNSLPVLLVVAGC